MKKTTTINLDTKSQLAKLIATENIIIQHNSVSTASFNTKSRVLTLPIFKEQSGDVYDMLIAHECAHALFTPEDGWKKICDDDELRTYVNVLEDTRIDKKIQKKYPGVVRNYINGFDILEKQNFFGMNNKDLNKELMLIDKINLRSKSSNRLPFIFTPDNNNWLAKVDAIKSFADVVRVAKDLLNWQKKQVEQMKKLPDFDEHPLIKNYELSDEDGEDPEDNKKQDVKSDENSDEQDEKNDKRDSEDKGTDNDLKDSEKDKEEQKSEPTQHASGADGVPPEKKLKAITNDYFEQKKEQLLDKKTTYTYGTLPSPNFNQCLVSYKTFTNDFRKHINQQIQSYPNETIKYKRWILDKFKKFRRENKKTVMYLVKEFEMKKAASAYKRASTDKTGIIDPLKLKNYKFSEDIFKKMTIIPDGKNHGMIMLLDWSGSMSDCISDTVCQLINLVEFVKKVNIPFEVYFFTSERDYEEKEKEYWNYKHGDFAFDEFKLVNCLSHRMKKNEFEESLLYLYHMARDYDQRWGSRDLSQRPEGSTYSIPDKYYLGNTPLNEALIVMNKLIPEFQNKYKVEKLTFITLTDGGANSFRHSQIIPIPDKPTKAIDEYEIKEAKLKNKNYLKKSIDYSSKVVITHKNKKIVLTDGWYGSAMTDTLLDIIKTDHKPTIVGFYIVKRIRRWDMDRFIGDYTDYEQKEKKRMKMLKEFRTENAAIVNQTGYDKYFLLNGKKMHVENFSLQDAPIKKGTGAELKRIFGKSMKNRLVSRVVLNKFIAEVA